MAKIPLEHTIGGTYRFAFTNILSVFGIIWLPYLILIAMIAGAVMMLLPDFAGIDFSQHPDVAHNQAQALRLALDVARFVWPFDLVLLVVSAMIVVGVQRKALGLHEGPVFVFFSLGAAVWRMLGAIILAVLAIAVTAGLTFALIGIVSHYVGLYAPGAAHAFKILAGCGGVLWIVYMAVRLTFFLAPVVVAEERIGLGRAWELGGGNFWRIVVVLIAVLVPPVIVMSIVGNVVFFSVFGGTFLQIVQLAQAHKLTTPNDVFALVWPQVQVMLPVIIAYYLIYHTIMTGLSVGASAIAYRSVTSEAKE
jgi:hypothetical protein